MRRGSGHPPLPRRRRVLTTVCTQCLLWRGYPARWLRRHLNVLQWRNGLELRNAAASTRQRQVLRRLCARGWIGV